MLRYSTVRHGCDELLHGSIGKDIDKLLYGNDKRNRFVEIYMKY